MMRLAVVFAVWCLVGASSGVASITADLSRHLIAITTAFTGTDVLLFGTIDQLGGDVVVTVNGPVGDEVVRKKNQIGPIWLNTEQQKFSDAPFFYAVASNRPIEEIAGPAVLRRHRIGVDNLRLRAEASDRPDEEIASFREGLIRNKQQLELYSDTPSIIEFVGPSLFRADLYFPANVQPGSYQVEALHFVDGQAVGAQRSTLAISKIGVEAEIYDLAHDQRALYGLVCIILAVAAGWTASAVFQRP